MLLTLLIALPFCSAFKISCRFSVSLVDKIRSLLGSRVYKRLIEILEVVCIRCDIGNAVVQILPGKYMNSASLSTNTRI